MILSRQDILQRVSKLAPMCSEFEFKISKPATEKQIAWRQKQLSRPIPQGLSEFASRTASRLSIRWSFDESLVADIEFDKDVQGSGEFEFNFFQTDLSHLEGWEDSFNNWQEYRSEPNPFEYENLFPLIPIINGNLIVAIIGAPQAGAVYYLDHEGGAGDWKRLAHTYDEFICTLAELWFPSPEWHNSLELFYDHDRQMLSSQCKVAQELDAFIRKPAE